MPRYHSDEVDGPAGQRDSLRNYYGGQPPQADKRAGAPWDTSGRDDSRRRSDAMRADEVEGDEDIITDEELALAMRGARRAAERRGAAEDDDGDGAGQPRMRIRCPNCGTRFQAMPPDGMSLAEVEDEDEAEGGGYVRAACPECEAKMTVKPPPGYKFQSDEDEDEEEGEDEDEQEDAKDIADTVTGGGRHMSEKGRRRAAEALVSAFFKRYHGKVLRETQARRRRAGRSTGSAALDSFIEAYRDELRFRRTSGTP